ncbi:TPX2 (targeting protein for Xklp2) protein family [Rhynchospora pubera]|uniref:TPX2 (Targeting protein for Xklp2) protein family n=1 Tax=Rhynchospora pubera TaxID=906938 RepID=A0AAV8BYK3_9POAL|nr:TPX2 (targeting protein for Xklp2) protein family [Rhynchospora pubera]
MTTDVDQGYFAWSQEELTQRDASTGVTISQMLDHGSVSFGKFEFESLSWEKWSVFRHDRRQEELEKFNGLVAEKKAYFEEYYKRMRALKALQQQQQQQEEQARQQTQQTELTLDYSVDGSLSEEEQETDMRRKVEEEMVVEDRRKDPEGSNVVENAGAEDTVSAVPIVGDATESDDRVSKVATKKLIGRRPVSKEPSCSAQSRLGLKQNSKCQTRPTMHKPQPPPPPPPRKTIRKTDKSNLVRTKEATRTIPISNIATTSIIAATKRPSSSASMRRPVSASGNRPSLTPRHPPFSTGDGGNRPSSTPRRPLSSAGDGGNRPSSTPRRPLSSSEDGGNRPSSTPRRPRSSAGDRGRGLREKVQRSDLSNNRMGAVTPGKMSSSIHGTPRMSIIPSTVKSTTTESKRQVFKDPSVLINNSTSVTRVDRYNPDAQKSRSINLPPKKNLSSSSASDTLRNKSKEVPKKNTTGPCCGTPRSNVTTARISASVRNATPSRIIESDKTSTHKPVPPRTSQTLHVGSRPSTSSSSASARKPKAEGKTWR